VRPQFWNYSRGDPHEISNTDSLGSQKLDVANCDFKKDTEPINALKDPARAVSPQPRRPDDTTPADAELSFAKKARYLLEYVPLSVVAAFFYVLPRKTALKLSAALGRLVGKIMRGRTALAKRNLKLLLPDAPDSELSRIISDCWANLGMVFSDLVQISKYSREKYLSEHAIMGMEHVRKSLEKGRGALIVTAHIGSWELSGQCFPFMDIPTAMIARRIKNPHVDRFVNRMRRFNGNAVIPARDAVRKSIRWLASGKSLAVMIDHRVAEGGLNIPLFGRPAATTTLPALLALRYDVPVHTLQMQREGESLRIVLSPEISFTDLAGRPDAILEATARMNRMLESWVREKPHEWLWIHNRWKMERE